MRLIAANPWQDRLARARAREDIFSHDHAYAAGRMTKPLQLDPDRFFPAEQKTRALARDLFARVEKLPILSPHGHTDPKWFATDAHFEDATSLFLWPDHYLLRMLYSAGLALEDLGLVPKDGKASQTSRRAVWKLFARNYHLFRGTPSRLWLDHAFATVFGLDVRLEEKTADHYFDVIGTALARDAFRPRALFRRFNLEVLATTEGALDPLHHHADMRKTWDGRVITTFRPDDVTDPDGADFVRNIEELGRITGENARQWRDGDGSWSRDGADRGSSARGLPVIVRQDPQRQARSRRRGAVPCADA